MAITQVTVVANQIEAQRIGYQAASLTNYDNTSEPQIASGSVVEIGGALFEAGSNESITGWSGIAVSSDVYIKLTVSGSTATASFTTSAPTWDTAKQGWYSGSDRYIGGLYKDGSGNYTLKWLYEHVGVNSIKLFGDGTIKVLGVLTASAGIRSDSAQPALKKAVIEIGDWNMDATASINVSHGLDASKIRHVSIIIRDDTPTNYYHMGGHPELFFLHTAANVAISRTASGLFDSTTFDATSYNRGWVMIEYEA